MRITSERTPLTSDGCYICQPDNPNAAEDGCSDCELAWEMYYEEAYGT